MSGFGGYTDYDQGYGYDTGPPTDTQASSTGGRSRGGRNARQPDHEVVGDQKAIHKIRSERRCTDVFCCLVFVAFWVGFAWITYTSLKRGNPKRLTHGFNYEGQLCGVDAEVAEKPLVYWPNPQKMKYPVCVAECPTTTSEKVPYPTESLTSSKSSNGSVIIEITQSIGSTNTYPSYPVANRICLPVQVSGVFANFTQDALAEQGSNALSTAQEYFQDLLNGWAILLATLPLAILLGYLYLVFMKHCAGIVTWGIIYGLLFAAGGLTWYCLGYIGNDEKKAADLCGKYSDDPVHTVKMIGYGAAAVTALFLITFCCIFRAVRSIVGVIKASCDAIWALPVLLPLPIIDIALKIVLFLIWVAFFIWVVSCGEVQSPTADVDNSHVHGLVSKFTYTTEDKVHIGVYIFGLLWGLETITAINHFIISYSVAIWYFTPCLPGPDYKKPVVGQGVFCEGLYRAWRYHMGSLALSAAIIAIFRVLHASLEVIAKSAKAQGNKVAEAIASCCMCCVWCFEEVVQYLNKNAIIEMVLQSKNFFTSAGAALKKLVAAGPEVAGLNGITVIVQLLGVAGVSSACAYVAWLIAFHASLYTSKESQWALNNPIVVVIAAGVIGLIVAAAYMFIFDMVSDTLLFCWLTDNEDGETEFAPKPLRDIVGKPKRGTKPSVY